MSKRESMETWHAAVAAARAEERPIYFVSYQDRTLCAFTVLGSARMLQADNPGSKIYTQIGDRLCPTS